MSFCILDMIDVNIYTVVFMYLTIKDILKLSTSSKILRIKCKEINGYVDQSIVVMELRKHDYLRTTLINRINFLITFPKISKLKFNCDARNKSQEMYPSSSSSYNSWCYCEFLDQNLFPILYNDRNLQNNLEELSLPIRSDSEIQFIHKLKKLRKLEIYFSFLSNFHLKQELIKLPNLSCLSLYNCPNITVYLLINIVKTDAGVNLLNNLIELNLSKCKGFNTNLALPLPLSFLSKLKYLNLSGTLLDNVGLSELSVLSNLESLDISDCENITNLSWLSSMHQLRTLSLEGNDQLERNNLINICNLSNLTSLNLGGCDLMTNANNIHFNLSSMQNLTYINLTHSNLSKDCFEGLNIPRNIKTLYLSDYEGVNFLICLENYTSLTSLSLRRCSFNLSLHFLGYMKTLESLDISNWNYLLASEIVYFEGLSNLKLLNLKCSFINIPDSGFLIISEYLVNLTSLHLEMSKLSTKGLTRLSKLSKLKTLEMINCDPECDDDNIYNFTFSGLTNLHTLILCNDRIGDELISVGFLKNLLILDISSSVCYFEYIPHLKGLSSLKQLRIIDTNMTVDLLSSILISLPSLNTIYLAERNKDKLSRNFEVKDIILLKSSFPNRRLFVF